MCPDRQILSIYIDGELPSPWKEKLLSHLEACPDCSLHLKELESLSKALRSDGGTAAMEAAQERVRIKLAQAIPATASDRPPRARAALWRRPLTLPLPAAIAAVAVVALVTVLLLKPSRTLSDKAMATISTELPQAIPASDISGVLHYLESQEDAGNIMIIRLPETGSFIPSGEPTLVRAADYHPGRDRP